MKTKTKSSAILTEQDFINAGYSPARAKKLSANPAFNWKAANGGKRAPLVTIHDPRFAPMPHLANLP